MDLTLSNVISALHRGPGIARADTPLLYEACFRMRKAVEAHLAVEGMRLLSAPNLGLFSAVCLSREEIEAACAQARSEPFAPVFNAAPLRYHESVMAVVLRKQRIGIEGNVTDWPDLEEIIHEFATFLPEEERGEDVRIRAAAKKALESLVNLKLAEPGTLAGGKETYRATGWLIVRLTPADMQRFTDVLLAAVEGDEDAAESGDEETGDE